MRADRTVALGKSSTVVGAEHWPRAVPLAATDSLSAAFLPRTVCPEVASAPSKNNWVGLGERLGGPRKLEKQDLARRTAGNAHS